MADKSSEFIKKLRNSYNSLDDSKVNTKKCAQNSTPTTHLISGSDSDKNVPRNPSIKDKKEIGADDAVVKQQQSQLTNLSTTEIDSKSLKLETEQSSDFIKNLQRTFGIITPKGSKTSDGQNTDMTSSKTGASNVFSNDGSFMAMFRKKAMEVQDQMEKETKGKGVKRTAEILTDSQPVEKKIIPSQSSSTKLPIVGRRKGPKMLKTGMVAKKVKEEEKEEEGKDAWSKYLAEVRKYKSQKCIEDDGGSTPLVK